MSKPILLVVCLIALSLLLALRFLFIPKPSELPEGKTIKLSATLTSEPKRIGSIQRFTLHPEKTEPLTVTTTRFPAYHYGEKLTLTGKIEKRVLNEKKTIKTMSFPVIELEKNTTFFRPFVSLRERILRFYKASLSPKEAALASGIVFGIRSQMPKDFEDSLQATGLMHIIAASGMNVSIIAGFFVGFFSIFLRRQFALTLCLFLVWSYAILAGLEASILRAATMASFAFAASLLGRQYHGVFALGLTGFLMLLVKPRLLTDIGFQLSFLASFGILTFVPLLQNLTNIQKRTGTFWKASSIFASDLFTTFAAQLTTTPVLLATFGTYGALSILVNLLVLWTIPFIMVIGLLGAVLGIILAPLGTIMLYLAIPFLAFLIFSVSLVGSFSLSFSLEDFPFSMLLGYYFLLFGVFFVLRQRYEKASSA